MKFLKPSLVALTLFAVIGCQEKAGGVAEVAPTLETQQQKQGYALGASIGMYMQRNLEEQAKLGLPVEKDLIIKGFLDGVEGNSLIEQEEIKALLMAFDASMKEKQQAFLAEEAAKTLLEGEAFLADNAAKEGVMVTESGLQYVVITEGEGAKPLATDTVKVDYKGTFINGETFDSSYDRGQAVSFPLNRVIPGWTEGVQLMSVGSKYKFTIPAHLAYGEAGNQNIPGNSVLEFEVELHEIQQPEAPVQVEAPAAE